MKVYRDPTIVVNLEDVSYIYYSGDKRTKFRVGFHLKSHDSIIWSQIYKTEEDCQRILKMCYDTMADD